MVIPLLLVGAAISSVAGLASGVLAGNKAEKLSNKARRALERVYSPTVDELSIDLDRLVRQGEITPEESRIVLQEASELQRIMVDPQFKGYQLEVLADFADLAAEQGLDPQAQAALYGVESELGRAAAGRRGAIQSDLRARGLGGSGQELAGRLAGEQGDVNAAALAGTQIAADARQRQLQALDALLSGSTAVRSQEFGEQARVAEAVDARNRFNATITQQQLNRDLDARERAQYANLAERQRIADTNVGFANEEERARANAVQQRFANDIARAGGVASNLQTQATQPNAYGLAANTFGNVASALTQIQRDQEIADIYRQAFAGGGSPSNPISITPGGVGTRNVA